MVKHLVYRLNWPADFSIGYLNIGPMSCSPLTFYCQNLTQRMGKGEPGFVRSSAEELKLKNLLRFYRVAVKAIPNFYKEFLRKKYVSLRQKVDERLFISIVVDVLMAGKFKVEKNGVLDVPDT